MAFCFYNISSIVNGLIYFDQFSLLSPAHLALVIVGMVVLLSGVGALSAREHGIELGTWREGGEALDAAIVDVDETDGVAEADVTATSPAAHPHVRFSFPLPLGSPIHSPRASTSICFDKSPKATAFVTIAIDRTWLVKLPAKLLTTLVNSRHVPSTSRTRA